MLNYTLFKKEWKKFVSNNPKLLKDVSDYMNNLLYNVDNKLFL